MQRRWNGTNDSIIKLIDKEENRKTSVMHIFSLYNNLMKSVDGVGEGKVRFVL